MTLASLVFRSNLLNRTLPLPSMRFGGHGSLQFQRGLHGLKAMSASASAKKTQGELVEDALQQYGDTSSLDLIDIGINLADPSFDQDRDAVITRARRAGVSAMVMTGSSLSSSRRARDICSTSHDSLLYFTAGVHPHDAKSCDEETLPALRDLASHPRCCAIGECGLDFNRNFSLPEVQERWFAEQVRTLRLNAARGTMQVRLANELQKPLFLHCRDAAERFTAILQEQGLSVPAVAHCFSGSKEDLEQYCQMGLHIGITGWVCDDRPDRGGAELAQLLKLIPPDKLMIETDGPYLVPRTIKPAKARPRRNEPALLPYVLTAVADAVGEDKLAVAARTSATARKFFKLSVEEGS